MTERIKYKIMKKIVTIKELNQRVWYRFLKVLYLLVVFMIVALIVGEFYSDISSGAHRQVNSEKSYITCNTDGDVFNVLMGGWHLKNFYSSDNGLMYESYLRNSAGSAEVIIGRCGVELGEGDYFINKAIEAQAKYEIEQNNLLSTADKRIANLKIIFDDYETENLKYSPHIFDVKLVFSYTDFILKWLFILVACCFVVELIRRVFYYIVLGRIFPIKK
jgi:hypothetical protein